MFHITQFHRANANLRPCTAKCHHLHQHSWLIQSLTRYSL